MPRTPAQQRNFLNQYSEELEGIPERFVSSKNKIKAIFDNLVAWRDDPEMPQQESNDLQTSINQGKSVLQNMLDNIV